jgi:hypothetical protein
MNAAVPGWLRRLARPGARLAPRSGGRSGYGVYAGADRRRRPLASVSDAALTQALEQGWLAEAQGGSFILTQAGRRCLDEGEAAGARPALTLARKTLPDPEGGLRLQTVNPTTLDGPLARYARPQNGRPALLEPVHLNAADNLMRDYERSTLTSRVTQSWSGVPGGGARSAPRDRSEAPIQRLNAQDRVMDALAAVGPGLDHWLVEILIRQSAMTEAERRLNWPSRSGAQALKLALDRLAVHYRLKPMGAGVELFER